MFNGIIFNTGVVKSIVENKKSIIIGIQSNLKFSNKEVGSSVSCNGVCLTVERKKNKLIFFYISNETIQRSNLKYLRVGNLVNLEKSLKFGSNISGHFTQGHVDSTAKIKKIKIIDKSWLVSLLLKNKNLSKFLIEKASISINGVSLTISKVYKKEFELNIIPHTLKLTNLKFLKKNDLVNVELDIFGKYIYKYTL
mgnify:CR=1 FL=1